MPLSIEKLYELYKRNPSIQTDSRKIKSGDLFFALKGPNFNGNDFALKALELGAAAAIIDEQTTIDDERIIQVDDALKTLQALGHHHRKLLGIPIIAITGSNGKTTTRELVSAVLKKKFKTYHTTGNLNNHIGIPLTLLSIKNDAEIAVIEMGASHQKEIEGYCRYAAPDYGIITNCGKAHLEGFGSEEGVRKGKGELYDYLALNNGTVFLFKDYPYLNEMAANRQIKHIWTYGTTQSDVNGHILKGQPFLEVSIEKSNALSVISTHLVGDYNLPNLLCAVAVGKYFKIPDKDICIAIEAYEPSNSRSQMISWGNNRIILDAYNANPSSMQAAINNFLKLGNRKKILILGGMKELGATSNEEHEKIKEYTARQKDIEVVFVGEEFNGPQSTNSLYFETAEKAGQWLKKRKPEQTDILIKGSRGSHLEEIFSRNNIDITVHF